MLTRRIAALMLVFAVAGCANGNAGGSEAAAPGPSSSDVVATPPSDLPSTEPSGGIPTDTAAETISGTVTAGVEPNCLVLQDAKGSHLLIFDDSALRADAAVGSRVTLTGRSDPSMMSTCQQGVPFLVTSVKAN
jgi:hypothetical protein